jgi:hypothetical protein
MTRSIRCLLIKLSHKQLDWITELAQLIPYAAAAVASLRAHAWTTERCLVDVVSKRPSKHVVVETDSAVVHGISYAQPPIWSICLGRTQCGVLSADVSYETNTRTV